MRCNRGANQPRVYIGLAARLVLALVIAAVFLLGWLLRESCLLSGAVVVSVCLVDPRSRLISHSARARGLAVIGAPESESPDFSGAWLPGGTSFPGFPS